MFNLFRSRDKAVRIALTVLLGLVALSMVTYLIPSTGLDNSGATNDTSVVAKIGNETLTAQEVSKAVQNVTRNRQLPSELLAIYVPQIVQQMISERTLAFEAKRLGIKVSSDETDNAILDSMPPDMIKNGKVDSATLSAVLQQQGITMSMLKSDTARQIMVSRLRQIVGEGVVISPKEIETEFHRRNDKIRVSYALITPARYQTEAEPTEAELKTYYEGHKAAFNTTEKRSLAILILDPGKVMAGMTLPSDDLLRKDYAANQDKFRTPERVNVRHILVKSDASDDAAKKAKAEGILKQIQGGGDFAKLAKASSDDPGSAEKGGELGWIVRGQTVPEFEKSAFSLQVGQTSGLVKTTYGYHILQVEQHEQARLQPLEEARGQLTADYMQRASNEQMQKLSDKAVAELRKDPAHPEKAAAAVDSTLLHADNIQTGDPIPGIGVSKEFNDAIAPLRKGEVTAGAVVLPGNKLAVAVITDYQAPHPASLDEARGEIRTKAQQEKAQTIVGKKAEELRARTKALGGDLEKAGKELGIEIKTSPDVDRQGAIEGVGSAAGISEAFSLPVDALFGPLGVTGGRVIGKVLAKTPANLADLPAQTTTLRDELRQQRTKDRSTLFEDGLKKKLQDDGSLKIHQDVINRIVQSYSQRS